MLDEVLRKKPVLIKVYEVYYNKVKPQEKPNCCQNLMMYADGKHMLKIYLLLEIGVDSLAI